MEDLAHSNVLVLGANGFIGRNLTDALVGKVRSLHGYGRSDDSHSFIPSELTWHKGDFLDSSGLGQALERADVVIHLISSSTPGNSNLDRVGDVESNLVPTLKLLDMCVSAEVKKVIFLSSGGSIYGDCSEVPTPESSGTNPITSYGVNKLAIEKFFEIYRLQYGLDYTIIRASNPYGPFQTAKNNQGIIGAILKACVAGNSFEVWGDGTVVRDFIFVDDLVEAIIKAISHRSETRLFNVGSGIGTSLLEAFEICKQVSKSDITLNFNKPRSVDVKVSVLDRSLASLELGWQPSTSLEAGIKKTFEWIKDSN
jgi:UDP-glucose 4-epimerase